MNDIVDRINSNRSAADRYAISDDSEGQTYAGTDELGPSPGGTGLKPRLVAGFFV